MRFTIHYQVGDNDHHHDSNNNVDDNDSLTLVRIDEHALLLAASGAVRVKTDVPGSPTASSGGGGGNSGGAGGNYSAADIESVLAEFFARCVFDTTRTHAWIGLRK